MSDFEEDLVLIEIEGEHGQNVVDLENYSLIGLDSDRPLLKLGGMIFQGRWENAVGTNLFLRSNPDSIQRETAMTYTGKSQKKLVFQRVQVAPHPIPNVTDPMALDAVPTL